MKKISGKTAIEYMKVDLRDPALDDPLDVRPGLSMRQKTELAHWWRVGDSLPHRRCFGNVAPSQLEEYIGERTPVMRAMRAVETLLLMEGR